MPRRSRTSFVLARAPFVGGAWRGWLVLLPAPCHGEHCAKEELVEVGDEVKLDVHDEADGHLAVAADGHLACWELSMSETSTTL